MLATALVAVLFLKKAAPGGASEAH
jgi:hypothetical protein